MNSSGFAHSPENLYFEDYVLGAAHELTANPLHERDMKALGQTANALDTFLRVLLGIVAIATLAGAIFLILKIDGGSGGRFYVAIVALVILGAVDSQFQKLVIRRQPFSLTTTEAERRYAMVGLSPNAGLGCVADRSRLVPALRPSRGRRLMILPPGL